jgi:hypothetical protein
MPKTADPEVIEMCGVRWMRHPNPNARGQQRAAWPLRLGRVEPVRERVARAPPELR